MVGKRILISALDWGWGHTTRIIPVIESLLNRKHKICFAGNLIQQDIIKKEFGSDVSYYLLNGYNVIYSSGSGMSISMGMQIPKIITAIKQEHQWLIDFIKDHPQDYIISDNRFGFYHPKVESIYITHQINIQAPLIFKPVLFNLHKKYIRNFHHCWIPDNKTSDLSGELSKDSSFKYYRIGPISRFKGIDLISDSYQYEYLAVLSGPEPQKSILERKLFEMFKKSKVTAAIVGCEGLLEKTTVDQLDLYPRLSSSDLLKVLSLSKQIISRSGYSTIMDFSELQKPIHFVPTPGQTEQEYLAQYHKKKSKIGYSNQDKLRLKSMKFGMLPKLRSDLLEEVLDSLNL